MLRTPDGYLLNGFDGPLAVRDTVVVPGAQAEDERPLEITIRDNGEVFVNQQYAGALALVEVSNPQSLLRTGASTFAPTEVTRYTTVAPEEAKVKQGYVEQSNVDIIREMVEMIQLQRGFELGTKVIQTNDGTLDKSIEISRVS
jgi:flagellar basal-body rod protein FlgG